MESANTGSRHDPRELWADPPALCGMPLHYCPVAAQNCWDAVGPAAEAWSALSPRIRAVGDDLAPTDSTFSIHIVMIGESKCTARPCILFCTTDGRLHEAVRDCRFLQSIMTEYPALTIEFSANPPEHLAHSAPPGALLAPGQQADPVADANGVWAADVSQKIGRRFYIRDPAGGPPRIATGGPIFFYGTKAYQTTVRHAFSRLQKPPPSEPQACFQSDLAWESSSDDSDDDEAAVDRVASRSRPAARGDQRGSIQAVEHVTSSEDTGPGSTLGLGIDPASLPAATQIAPAAIPASADLEQHVDSGCVGSQMPADSIRIGTAMQETIGGGQRHLDYVLVEVQVSEDEDASLVSFDHVNKSRQIRVTKPGYVDMIKRDANPSVVVITSSRPANGKLLTTPAYVKPNGWSKSQTVYPIRMDEGQGLEPGDCGSAVIDILEGRVFGHIVFGHPGTKIAYMLPMGDIINDIAQVLGPHAQLQLSQQRTGSGAMPSAGGRGRAGGRGEYRTFTEFASPRYYEGVNHRTMPEKHILRSLVGTIEDKVGGGIRALAARHRKTRRPRRDGTFESLFFSLPPELRDNIIQFLDFRSAMSLRRVSQRWRDEVSVNCLAIAKHFLDNHPLPLLATQLYPHTSPDVSHIQKVGSFHATASRLADYISTWLTREMFLHETRIQLVDFKTTKLQIKRRLVPPLFILVHFFQTYSQYLLRLSRHRGCPEEPAPCHIQSSICQLERRIMSHYDTPHILQTQDAALILITYLQRIMNPPSKYGRVERAIHHYLKEPPSDQELAGVLCLGGLDLTVRLLDTGGYDKRVAAVHAFLRSRPPPQLSQLQHAGGQSEETAALQANPHEPEDLRALLPHVPALDDIWHRTGEKLLLERGAIRTPRELHNYQQALHELIQRDEIPADQLYGNGHAPWHALCDKEIRQNDHTPSEI